MENLNKEYILAALSYLSFFVFPVFAPLIFIIIFSRSKFILFHSIQAFFIQLIFYIIAIELLTNQEYILRYLIENGNFDLFVYITSFGFIIFLASLIFGAYKASIGEKFRFPIIGKIAEKIANL
ncbi:protein of unknown function UPF0132 [Methanocaldococcus sp. FS406-22]|uniref:hypothetical protein n=1 Tax=Methanocaldococcus sp. (strain FS406-22) TaxID=644281 RepID=UPI0001BF2A5C|nr:hypothetical protein [Methanocaldococcus sp. FS406-22]ADC69972.1 protein of unknown function UPF0132 [Methanocaldococcus sp. FS406-22]